MFLSTVVVVLLVSLTSIVNCEDADCNNDDEVNLSVIGNKDICPSQPVTLRCVVKKLSNQQFPFLSWRCSGSDNEKDVICKPILDFNCEFGKVVNVTGSCKCEDTVIVSEATFIPNPDSAGNLTCGNGAQDETVSLSVKALYTPTLNYTVVSENRTVRNVTVEWRTPDSGKGDIEYVLSLRNISFSETIIINKTHYNLSLMYGMDYTVEVASQRCKGQLKSNPSEQLRLSFSDSPTLMIPGNQLRPTSNGAPDNTDPVAEIIGGVLGGALGVLVLVAVVVVVLGCLLWRKRRVQKNAGLDVELVGSLDDEHVGDYGGRQLTKQEKEDIKTLQDDNSRMKSSVGGLFVHRDEIYYSCCEKYTKQPGEIYTLHICNKAGKSKRVLGGFNHIRGIDKDTNDCIYVVDSSNKRILKFDRDWTGYCNEE